MSINFGRPGYVKVNGKNAFWKQKINNLAVHAVPQLNHRNEFEEYYAWRTSPQSLHPIVVDHPPTNIFDEFQNNKKMQEVRINGKLIYQRAKEDEIMMETQKEKEKLEAQEKAIAEQETKECVICFDNKRTTIFVPCGHHVSCGTCAEKVKDCPICKKKINQKIKVFSS